MIPSEKKLNEIQARAEAATNGPWTPFHEAGRDPDDDIWTWLFPKKKEYPPTREAWNTDHGCPGYGLEKADAEFCAHARTDIPMLVAAVRKLKKELDRAKAR